MSAFDEEMRRVHPAIIVQLGGVNIGAPIGDCHG